MEIKFLKRNQVATPVPGQMILFYDLDNGSVLTYKDSDCNFFSLNEMPSINSSSIDNCICDVTKKIIDDSGCALNKGIMTPTEYESVTNNINLYSVVSMDSTTGGYAHSITSSPSLFINFTHTEVTCNGSSTGTASAVVTGGVGPYTMDWKDSSGATADPSSLPSGAFTLTVTDSNGTIKVISFVISEPPALALTVNVTNESAPSAADGVASAIVSGGSPIYTYVWNDNIGTPIGQVTQTATGLSPGTYQVVVTDSNGCTIDNLNVIIA